MAVSYNMWLVALSYIVAVSAAYSAIRLSRKIVHTTGGAKLAWLTAGATSMGLGIWTMHLVGIIAMEMNMVHWFDIPLTLYSLIIAIVVSACALHIASRNTISTTQVLVSGVLLGLGKSTTHYVGMFALEMDAVAAYDPIWVTISILVGIFTAAVAVFVICKFSTADYGDRFSFQLLAASIIGVSICGVHYTGMAGISYKMTHSAQITHEAGTASDSHATHSPKTMNESDMASDSHATHSPRTMNENDMAPDSHATHSPQTMNENDMVQDTQSTPLVDSDVNPRSNTIQMQEQPKGWVFAVGGQRNDYTNLLVAVLSLATLVIIAVTHLTVYFDYKISKLKDQSRQAEREALQLAEILDDSSNEFYLIDVETFKFIKTNKSASDNLQYTEEQLKELTPSDIAVSSSNQDIARILEPLINGEIVEKAFDGEHRRADGSVYPVNIHFQYSQRAENPLLISIVTDITERKNLENEIIQARKMESIGQLAAGIAHEINTPAQFVGDNSHFLKDAFNDLNQLISQYKSLMDLLNNSAETKQKLADIVDLQDEIDIEYLEEEIPVAINQSIEGISRISKIVQAMKEFSHPGGAEMQLVDINKNILNTITVASNEWKYVAEVETDLSNDIPPIPCHPQEISQVLLNLIVNAAHAIEDQVQLDQKKSGSNASATRGVIRVTSKASATCVQIDVEDTGCGVPSHIQSRIFDPFFTTKEVGKGTGQGLALAYATIVEKHKGQLALLPVRNGGTTFRIQLPLAAGTEFSELAA